MNHLFQMLEIYRTRAGLTNEQVSRALSHNYESYYRQKIAGNSKLSTDDLVKLIHLYNLTDREIIDLFKPTVRGGRK